MSAQLGCFPTKFGFTDLGFYYYELIYVFDDRYIGYIIRTNWILWAYNLRLIELNCMSLRAYTYVYYYTPAVRL